MNDLVRPAFYDAFHAIEPVGAARKGVNAHRGRRGGADLRVGRLPGAASASWPGPARGTCSAVRSAGAYGFTMSSNYNTRPRAAEVLVDGDRALLARERETYPT